MLQSARPFPRRGADGLLIVALERVALLSEARPGLPREPIARLTEPLERFMHVESASGILAPFRKKGEIAVLCERGLD